MRTRDGLVASFVAASLLVAGCGGGQTGDLGGFDNGGETAGGGCVDQEQPLESSDAASQLGFSVNDVLDWVEGTHESSLVWGTPDAVAFSPSGTTTDASFVFDCPEPKPRLVDSEPKPSDGGLVAAEPDLGASCPDSIRVDCELSVTTADGGLDETWNVVVDAQQADLAQVHHALEPDAFTGSFEIGDTTAENTEVKQLGLSMQLTRFGLNGSLSSVLESNLGDAVSASFVDYAHWPAESCEEAGSNAFIIDENSTADEGSSTSIVAALLPDADRSVKWDGGVESPLSLELSPETTGCVEVDVFDGGYTAYYPSSVSAKSDDGRLDMMSSGTLRASFDDARELVYATVQVSVTPDTEQVAALMDASTDEAEQLASEYDELEMTLTQTFDFGTSMGYVRLLGATIPDCLSNPPEPMQGEQGGGAPGCAGIDQQVLFEGTWSP